VPRAYIELLADRAVSPALQRRMYASSPCRRVLSIDASHSAYFSKPDELVDKILVAGGDGRVSERGGGACHLAGAPQSIST
jgi:hypothetical protein